MRTMYDSTNPADIPATAAMVAGYVDGIYGPNFKAIGRSAVGWDAAGWARFPAAVKVRIAVFAATNDGQVLDVETFDATPAQAPGWVRMRLAAGIQRPTLYVNRANWAAVAAACAGLPVDFWVATLDGTTSVIPPAGVIYPVAVQYAGASAGGHFDSSVVADHWAAVDSVFGPGGGQVGADDMTPEEHTWLEGCAQILGAAPRAARDLDDLVATLYFGADAAGDRGAPAAGAVVVPWLADLRARIAAIPGGASAPVDLAPVLAAIADLKAHPAVVADPSVLAIVTRMEAGLKAA